MKYKHLRTYLLVNIFVKRNKLLCLVSKAAAKNDYFEIIWKIHTNRLVVVQSIFSKVGGHRSVAKLKMG